MAAAQRALQEEKDKVAALNSSMSEMREIEATEHATLESEAHKLRLRLEELEREQRAAQEGVVATSAAAAAPTGAVAGADSSTASRPNRLSTSGAVESTKNATSLRCAAPGLIGHRSAFFLSSRCSFCFTRSLDRAISLTMRSYRTPLSLFFFFSLLFARFVLLALFTVLQVSSSQRGLIGHHSLHRATSIFFTTRFY